jgi:molybdenum cofactor cytidylyltransferase
MPSRYFAIIPAAGHSTRMGRPKLLLPVAGQPLVCHTLAAWQRSSVERIVVVVRPGDHELAAAIARSKVQSPESKVKTSSTLDLGPWTLDPLPAEIDLVIPDTPPADMKASLQAALGHIERQYRPTADDAFLVAPADMPGLKAAIIDRLIHADSVSSDRKILAPTIAGQRGHPVLFPWPMAALVHKLADQEGLNAIAHRHPPVHTPCEDLVAPSEYPFADIDTPEDYRQMTSDQ